MNDPTTITRHELLRTTFDPPASVATAQISRVELGPGQRTGRHRHPGHVLGTILSGTIRFQIDSRPVQVLPTGAAFHEPAGVEIPHFDNASETEPASSLACYLLPAGEQRLIEMLPAG